jgi:TfoX/Sxy family transcriptional regulator of competence genes
MAYDEGLAERIRHVFGERRDVTERKMFGGLAFLLQGRMCCGIVGSDLMVRVTDDEFDAVMRDPHVRPMDFTGKPLRGFVYIAPRGVRTARALRTWLSRGERVARENAVAPKTRARRRSAGSSVRSPRRVSKSPGAATIVIVTYHIEPSGSGSQVTIRRCVAG